MPDGLRPDRGGIWRRSAGRRRLGRQLWSIGSGGLLVLGVLDLVAFGGLVGVLERFHLADVAFAVWLLLSLVRRTCVAPLGRRFRLTLNQDRRRVAEATDVEVRGNPDRLDQAVGKALCHGVGRVEPGLGRHQCGDLLRCPPGFRSVAGDEAAFHLVERLGHGAHVLGRAHHEAGRVVDHQKRSRA